MSLKTNSVTVAPASVAPRTDCCNKVAVLPFRLGLPYIATILDIIPVH